MKCGLLSIHTAFWELSQTQYPGVSISFPTFLPLAILEMFHNPMSQQVSILAANGK